MEAPGDMNPEMPKEGAEPTVRAQIPDAKEPAILALPLQAIPLTEVPKSIETDPAQPSQKRDVSLGPEASPALPSKDMDKTTLKK